MIQSYASRNLYTKVILVAHPEIETHSKKYERWIVCKPKELLLWEDIYSGNSTLSEW